MQIQSLKVDTKDSVSRTLVELPKLSWASQQAIAILAVDGMRPSVACIALMQAIDAETMTHDEAVASIKKRAVEYSRKDK